jgi:ABC-2 type transport system ATP-binding protein
MNEAEDGPILQVDGIHRRFPGTPPIDALRGVSFAVRPGEVLGILGMNGAGKTTLIKILSTLLHPSAGSARVGGYDVVTQAREVRARISVVLGGDRGLYNRLSALDNLRFFASLHGIRKDLRDRCMAALERVGLQAKAGSRVETLSKGMRQRLNLAIGLLNEPRLLLLDEPTIGLDVFEAGRMRDTVAQLADTGTAIVLTSHYPIDIDHLATRIVFLEGGRITHDMTAEQFRQQVGYIAEIHISGDGASPAARSGADVSVRRGTGPDQWTVSLRVHAWEPSVFDEASQILNSHRVTDVEVQPVSVETVLRSLARSRA